MSEARSILTSRSKSGQPGVFVISLDFELRWGMSDKQSVASCRENMLGAREAIPRILDLFEQYEIHATWATVGLLFAENRAEMVAGMPTRRPQYDRPALSAYTYLDLVGEDEDEDPLHYAASIIQEISMRPGQEIGTHTFSHYYCREPGQTIEEFREDLAAAVRIAGSRGFHVRSIVFPRNQVRDEYLAACMAVGIDVYRGNPYGNIYEMAESAIHMGIRRLLRFADTYLPLTNTLAKVTPKGEECPANVPASRFLRPYSPKLRVLEPLRLARILGEMERAAKNGMLYHLWWHPHNFGRYTDQNMRTLKKICEHYSMLRDRFGMLSRNMAEAADSLYSARRLPASTNTTL